jgi:hypothetical protein
MCVVIAQPNNIILHWREILIAPMFKQLVQNWFTHLKIPLSIGIFIQRQLRVVQAHPKYPLVKWLLQNSKESPSFIENFDFLSQNPRFFYPASTQACYKRRDCLGE